MGESYRFSEVFKRFAPGQSNQIDEILQQAAPTARTPFLFALTAFGREFIGLSRYVEARLENATRDQKDILTFLSLAYYYGHKAVYAQVFAAHLGLSESRAVKLESVLTDLQRELLVREDGSKWRPAHQLIAEEILSRR